MATPQPVMRECAEQQFSYNLNGMARLIYKGKLKALRNDPWLKVHSPAR